MVVVDKAVCAWYPLQPSSHPFSCRRSTRDGRCNPDKTYSSGM